MRRLLTHLAQFSAFASQAELLCTRGLEHLLADEQARDAVAKLWPGVSLPTPGAVTTWHAEAKQDDGARPDLEGRTAEGKPLVKVEAKLDAALRADQLESYAHDLAKRSAGGLLVVLVPSRREGEARRVLEGASLPDEVTRTVLTWERVIEGLRDVRGEHFESDLAQFEAMYLALVSQYVAPLASEEVLRTWRTAEASFIKYVDTATVKLTGDTRIMPLDYDVKARVAEGDEAHVPGSRIPRDHYLRRYVSLTREEGKEAAYSLGVRDPFAPEEQPHRPDAPRIETPVWLRFHAKTGSFAEIRKHLLAVKQELHLVESGGHLWIPIRVPVQKHIDEVVEAIVEQVERVCHIALGDRATSSSALRPPAWP